MPHPALHHGGMIVVAIFHPFWPTLSNTTTTTTTTTTTATTATTTKSSPQSSFRGGARIGQKGMEGSLPAKRSTSEGRGVEHGKKGMRGSSPGKPGRRGSPRRRGRGACPAGRGRCQKEGRSGEGGRWAEGVDGRGAIEGMVIMSME